MQPELHEPIPLNCADPAVQMAEQQQRQEPVQSSWTDALGSVDVITPVVELAGPAVEVVAEIGKSGVELAGQAIGAVLEGLG